MRRGFRRFYPAIVTRRPPCSLQPQTTVIGRTARPKWAALIRTKYSTNLPTLVNPGETVARRAARLIREQGRRGKRGRGRAARQVALRPNSPKSPDGWVTTDFAHVPRRICNSQLILLLPRLGRGSQAASAHCPHFGAASLIIAAAMLAAFLLSPTGRREEERFVSGSAAMSTAPLQSR
jgi:hypothetical protein